MTLPRTRPPLPARPAAVELGPDPDALPPSATPAARGQLLHDVSVARAACVLTEMLRDPEPWVRALLTGLEPFRQAQPGGALDAVLARAWREPGSADGALADFARARRPLGAAALAELCFGPKLWFTTNGVVVTWRPMEWVVPVTAEPWLPRAPRSDDERQVEALAVLRRHGVSQAEAERLRCGDIGRLAPGAVFVPDPLAEPLAVRLAPAGPARLVFLPYEDRITVLAAVLSRHGAGSGCEQAHEPLLELP